MYRVTATIEGTSPLLMNRFTEENEISVSSGRSKSTKAGKGTPREQAEPRCYKDKDGILYIPGTNIFSCIIQAGTFFKLGKAKVTTQKSSLIPAGIIMESLECSLDTRDFEVDSRRVVIPATGGAIMAHRPRLDVWKTTFAINVDDEIFDPDFVREIIDAAGSKVGLGDFRPQRKGPFGRFVVTKWEVEKVRKAA